MMNRRGMTVTDVLLIVAIGVFALLDVALLDDVYQVHERESCYANQQGLDNILWETCSEKSREVWDVNEAYSVHYPDNRHPVLVVVFNPAVDAETPEKEVVVVDLAEQKWTTAQTCPLRDAGGTEPVIDYWFAFGRWHCLFNRYHSQ